MIHSHDALYKDFEAVRQITIIPTMLDVICRITGLGFAAVARVTEDRWLACSVRDDVNFGLSEGEELKVETTICNEIRDNRQPVIIDHVAKDEHYKEHHTPKMYGLQSYISFPIILRNGEFFGTLCAIGTEPAKLNDPKITGTFTLFAELVSFHLESMELMSRSHIVLKETHRQLTYSNDENLLYRKVSDHNLQEKLRKIKVFSDMLLNTTGQNDAVKTTNIAQKINSAANELSNMIRHLSKFSALTAEPELFKTVDLNKTALDIKLLLATTVTEKATAITLSALPVLHAVPEQMDELFFQLANYALNVSANNPTQGIHIYSKNVMPGTGNYSLPAGDGYKLCEIFIEQTVSDAKTHNSETIFDIFVHVTDNETANKYDAGLAHCRKIAHNHGGIITAHTHPNKGISFCIVLPLNYKVPALTEGQAYAASPD